MRPRPRVLIQSAIDLYGEDEVIEGAMLILSGQDHGDALDIRLLGGSPEWAPYWYRVWAARAFLYVWNEVAAAAVVEGLGDEHWRVREMCAKVCRLRELTAGSAALVELAKDEVERVRLAALIAIGDVCEADAAGPLLAGQFESRREAQVAAVALQRLENRLDRRLR